MKVDAWILEPAKTDNKDLTQLKKGMIELKELGPKDVLVEPIYGCWEGNMGHAVDRNPIDICIARKENQVVIGNAGVVRVLKTGSHLPGINPGQIYMLFSGDTRELPRYNYPIKAYGYDSAGTLGLLAKQTIVHWQQLLPIPTNTRFSLKQWAAFSLRYVTAWGNWKVAHQTYRSMVSEEEAPHPPVWGWGGGVSLATLQLAKAAGYSTTLIASNSNRLSLIETLGINTLDRNQFTDLDYQATLINPSKEQKSRYKHAERTFLNLVKEKTNDHGVAIFVDLIGEPVLKATIKALARPGVLTTAGWKKGMHISYLRATACIQWQAYIHTHYGSLNDAQHAMAYGEANGWMPPIQPDEPIYQWEQVNELLHDFCNGSTNYFPIYQVNPE
jgi:NADPH:quinone reductase-like Zn-dependent oxidoreductase